MQLDMNVTDPAKNLHGLKLMIRNSCWLYLRNIRHFQLYPTVLLNRTTFHFEVSMTVIRLTRSMGLTETHPRFKLIYCLTKWFNSSLVHWITLLKYDHSRRSYFFFIRFSALSCPSGGPRLWSSIIPSFKCDNWNKDQRKLLLIYKVNLNVTQNSNETKESEFPGFISS